MLKAKKSAVVSASVNKVLDCLNVFLRYGEWNGETYLEVEKSSEGPLGPEFVIKKKGARNWTETHHQLGPWPFMGIVTTTTHHREEIQHEVRVIRFIRNEKLAVERNMSRWIDGDKISSTWATERLSYDLHPSDYGGTLITLSGNRCLTLSPGIPELILLPFLLVFWPMLWMRWSRTVAAHMSRLKWAVESPSSYPFPLKCSECKGVMSMFATDWKPPKEIQTSEQICPQCEGVTAGN